MLIIRGEQIDAFRAKAQLEFEQLLVKHAQEFAAKHTEVLGPEGTLAVVRLCIERGRAHGFTGQGPLELFLDLMFLLGAEFDTDPQYRWAAEALSAPGGQMDKADRLHAASITYLDAVAGPDQIYARAALEALQKSGTALARASANDFRAGMVQAMHQLYPQKAEYLGEDRLQAAVDLSLATCQTHGIQSIAGQCLITALIFTLGHAIARDPLYPWVGRTLNDPIVTDPDQRAQKLYSRTKMYMQEAIKYLGSNKG
jgi:hypothetical protein